MRKVTHARKRNAWADRDELLHWCRGPRRNHVCRFVLRSLTGFGRGGGLNFGFLHRLASSPLQHSRITVRVCDHDLEIWVRGHRRSFKLAPLEACTHFIVTMTVCLADCEISNVKEWRKLENWVMGRSRSLKMAPFDRPCRPLYNFRVIWRWIICDLKIWVRGHSRSLKLISFESLVRFPVRLP